MWHVCIRPPCPLTVAPCAPTPHPRFGTAILTPVAAEMTRRVFYGTGPSSVRLAGWGRGGWGGVLLLHKALLTWQQSRKDTLNSKVLAHPPSLGGVRVMTERCAALGWAALQRPTVKTCTVFTGRLESNSGA